jgi:hypothetical protein
MKCVTTRQVCPFNADCPLFPTSGISQYKDKPSFWLFGAVAHVIHGFPLLHCHGEYSSQPPTGRLAVVCCWAHT